MTTPQEDPAQDPLEALAESLEAERQRSAELTAALEREHRELEEVRLALQTAVNDVWAIEEVQQALEAVGRSGSEFLLHLDARLRGKFGRLLADLEGAAGRPDLGDDLRSTLEGVLARGREVSADMARVVEFCRIDAGHVPAFTQPTSTTELLERVVARHREHAERRGLGLRWDRDPQVPEQVLLDPALVEVALDRLVENALTFSAEGDVTVGVGMQGVREDRELGFFVLDSGPGILEEDLGRVCEAFERGKHHDAEHLGLGLAVVRRTAELLGGELRLESHPGAGTRASLTFHVAGLGVLPLDFERALTPRILVVEDNPVSQRLVVSFLSLIGCEVATAGNGAEGIQRLTEDPFDLVVMDCMMPEVDGYEATRRIRAGEAGSDRCRVPIVALTADDNQGARQACLESGMDDYMSKPVTFDGLRSMLGVWLPQPLRVALSR